MFGGKPASVHDYRRAARRRLPRTMFEYLDGGSLDEGTMAHNTADFEELHIRQRALATATATTAAQVMGQPTSMPLMLAPLGSLGMMYPQGELCAFRAAHKAGIGACLSSFSICSIEDVAPEVRPSDAFQLYVLKDTGRTAELVARAHGAGFRNLVLTVDTTHTGLRDRDLRNGYRSVRRVGPRLILDGLLHPSWLLRNWAGFRRGLGNYRTWPDVGQGLMEQAVHMAGQLNASLTWHDVAALRREWPGRLTIKGLTTAEDVAHAIEAGADSVVVSNHGGRQLDGTLSTIRALPAIAEAHSHRVEIVFDSGIRRGSHIFKAMAAGAHACLLGRAYAYALAAGGETGVTNVLGMLRNELVMTMVLAGCPDIPTLRGGGRKFLTG